MILPSQSEWLHLTLWRLRVTYQDLSARLSAVVIQVFIKLEGVFLCQFPLI